MKGFIQARALAVFLAIATCLFTGCTKEGSFEIPRATPGTVTGAAGKVSKISSPANGDIIVEYNTDKTIKKVTSLNDPSTPGIAIYNLVYTSGVLTEMNGLIDDIKYTYTGGIVTKMDVSSLLSNVSGTYDFTYKNGFLTQLDSYLKTSPPGLPPSMRFVYEYSANGNVQKMSIYFYKDASKTLEKEEVVEYSDYDDKNNTIIMFDHAAYFPLQKPVALNNPGKETRYDNTGKVTETTIYTYTYDNTGNPVKRTAVTKVPGQQDKTDVTQISY
ncbi:hypothetical protein [Sediminibacterium ginsengisoli]|uniref:YD repeat-containing protein n=1 Tax=Sediminibacterium ginsengisoli TaxID=413434 RepID=A0A1T4MIE6_9BACT|nr:hypothetical protein [Sediminibacterium ginsengisoli]SJZ66647.1 hypothetical protein SAMN04488132_103402 [Sediminibacterium ginsengisoli]